MSGGGGSDAACGRPPHWEALARAAAWEDPQAVDADLRQLLTFVLQGELYAVAVERVREIVRIRRITPMPRAPAEVRGVISLRGEIVEVIDMRTRLHLASADPTRGSRILVVLDDEGRPTGIVVDAVTEVLRVGEEAIRPPPPGASDAVEALCARGNRFVSLIDLDRVLKIHAEH